MIATNQSHDDGPERAKGQPPARPAPRRRPAEPSKVEAAKEASRYLRGGIRETLDNPVATRFEEKDEAILKFHGLYQQYDRDARAEGHQGKNEREYSCMVRCRIPSGILTPEQYLVIDQLGQTLGQGSLRLTTRQAIQFHGVLKGEVRPLIRALNDTLVSTLAACGDVMRNVMCCPLIDGDPARRAVQQAALDIALALAPRTTAYHDIWLAGERLKPGDPTLTNGCASHAVLEASRDEFEVEPWYGKLYLPRKFKMGIALPDDNCIDVYTQDCGLIAVLNEKTREVVGYNLLVGGGLGMTHRKADTFARLASTVGFIEPHLAIEAVRTVIEIFRDHGDREERRHARLKYVIEAYGVDWFIDEFNRRASHALQPPAELPPLGYEDHLGWTDQGDGLWTYGLFIENGRLRDVGPARKLAGVRAAVEQLRPGVRLTPHQNILFTHVAPHRRGELLDILRAHGVPLNEEVSRVRLNAMACPALPTCGLALSDAERSLPEIIDAIEPLLEELGLAEDDIGIRMTGCPNGCARPYTADIGFVGRSPGVYDVYCGGRLAGDRLVDLLGEKVKQEDVIALLRPVLTAWRDERLRGEGFGDYWQRRSGRPSPRTLLTGAKDLYNPTLHGEPMG
jgi:sulfite reductase (ferredoxin)